MTPHFADFVLQDDALMAAWMLALEDESDMIGSLRNLAAFAMFAVFARPEVWRRRIRRMLAGRETFLASLTTDRPMARDITDLVLLLDVQVGEIPFARCAAPIAADLRSKRIGWLGNWGGAHTMGPDFLALGQAYHQATDWPSHAPKEV